MKNTYFRIFLFALVSALIMTGLKMGEYYFFASQFSLDIYLGIIALLFLIIGAGIGYTFFASKQKKTSMSYEEIVRTDTADTSLTTREIEVLSLIARGYSNQQIAGELYISLNTVKTHTKNIYSKLDAKRRTQAVANAKKLKILR